MYQELNKLVDFLNGKRILIAGFGREGQSSLRFLLHHVPDAKITVGDKRSIAFSNEFSWKDIATQSGENYLGNPNEFDLMLKSPGISLKEISTDWIISGNISSQTDLLLRFFGNQVIGITGTKGKSTTTTLVHHLLVNNERNALLAGNMGLPFFDQVVGSQNKLIVAELSSHQLEMVYASPAISILLNIFPEHLDHYNSFHSYVKAKWNIALYQRQCGKIFIPACWEKKEWQVYQQQCLGRVGFFGTKDSEVFFDFNGEKVSTQIDIEQMSLIGEHNLANVSAALGAVVSAGVALADAVEALYSFKPLPHRLEFVREVNNITFINDSISTIPQSAIAALNAFPKTETIILGGFNRGIDYTELIEFLLSRSVQNIILMGEVGNVIGKEIESKNQKLTLFYALDMQAAVDFGAKNTRAGNVCLLSPAAASYDKYINFEYRGDDFKKHVNAI